jgi:aminoglycoside phosphotransferase (APT) family kinase protein
MYILRNEGLPPFPLGKLNAGTNAVFRSDKYVIKIFAPKESGFDEELTFESELFATKRVNSIIAAAPKTIAFGTVFDKYRFDYMVSEFIEGELLEYGVTSMTYEEKFDIGRRLRKISDSFNTPCEPFNELDIIKHSNRCGFWDKFPARFQAERLEYITNHDYGDKVFVHGDMCMDNIILTPDRELYVIDYADALLAPLCYEHCIMPTAFEFDKGLTDGYFEGFTNDELIDTVFNGLLIQHFGAECIKHFYPDKKVGRYKNLAILKEEIIRILHQ